jgi:hypothetical protein
LSIAFKNFNQKRLTVPQNILSKKTSYPIPRVMMVLFIQKNKKNVMKTILFYYSLQFSASFLRQIHK